MRELVASRTRSALPLTGVSRRIEAHGIPLFAGHAVQPKPVLLTAQLIISGLMALMMSGIMLVINAGFVDGLFRFWMGAFFTAWPIAFVLSLGVGPIAFRLAFALVGPKRA